MDVNELRNEWLRAAARERGYAVSDTDACDLELTTEGDGCCDMCYSEYAVLYATVGKNTFRVDTY